jgi:SAM-dependent methyltransferase
MKISHSYEGLSRGYSQVRKGTPRFAAFVISRAGLDIGKSDKPFIVVELGAGSGQQTEFVEKQLKAAGISEYRILAYDKSYDQLDLLRERINKGEISRRVTPVKLDFDVKSLPLESASVDVSYMAWVLHHLTDQQGMLNEIARISRQGARHFMYQVTLEAMKNHPLDEFFPTKFEYDKQRYPTRSQLRNMFRRAGFTYETPYAIKGDDPKPIDRVFLENIENTSFDSALHMIKDDEPLVFAEGVERVRREVARAECTGDYRIYTHNRRQVFWGIRK